MGKEKNQYMVSGQTEIAARLLSEKYNEDFDVLRIGQRYGTMSNDTFTATCCPTRNKKLVFDAEISKEGDYLEDEYIARVVCEALTEELDAVLAGSSADAAVLTVSRPTVIEGTDASVSADAVMEANENLDFVFYVVKESSVADSEILDAVTALKNRHERLGGEVRIFSTDNAGDITAFAQLTATDKTFTSDMKNLLIDCESAVYNIADGTKIG